METASLMWKGASMDSFRQVMDPGADAAIASLYKSGSVDSLRQLLVDMASNDALIPDTLPAPMQDFLKKELSVQFSDKDVRMFERTHQIWKENGIQFIYILFFRALPYTYMAEKPANVLRMTRLLEDQPERRIFETAQFVFDVMDEGWWKPGRRGMMTALKVRIMHAAMRYVILNREGGEKWDLARWGMPISQEDLIATNQCFSLEFFKGMEMLGQPLSPEDQEAWFHTWRTIGKIMGIEDGLLTDNVEEGWNLQKKVYAHLFMDDNYSGVGLAASLVKTLSTFLLSEKLVLLMMRKMILDQDYPDLFYQVLGPTYGKKHPKIFSRTRSAEESNELEELLGEDFYTELKTYTEKVKDYRQQEKAANPGTRGEDDKVTLLDAQLDEFSDILRDLDPDSPSTRGLLDEVLKRAMNSVGAVIISMLSKYFRPGKQSGFRVPRDLKEHWAL